MFYLTDLRSRFKFDEPPIGLNNGNKQILSINYLQNKNNSNKNLEGN